MAVHPIPDGYTTVTPYIYVRGCAAALDFYKAAFGATELMRFSMPDGSVAHAEIQIGNARIMLGDENPMWGNKSPATLGDASGGICLYVENADKMFAQAMAAGAKEMKPMADQFYGDRSGTVTDPFGHHWTIATHIEDVSVEEMHKRMEAWTKNPSA